MNQPSSSSTQFESITSDVSGVIEIHCCAVSDILRKNDIISEKIRSHIIRWFLNPDIGSPFDRKTKLFRNRIPKKWIIPLMHLLGYDGLIALYGEDIIGHAFFQKHNKKTGDELHLFSIAVAEETQRRGIGTKIGEAFIEFGRDQQKHINRLRVGGGGDETVKAIFRKISAQSECLGIETDEKFFITFKDRKPRIIHNTVLPKI